MELRGHVEKGVIVLDDAAKLPDGTEVTIAPIKSRRKTVKKKTRKSSKPTVWEVMRKFAGQAKGLPSDLARNHDHYLHGHPKK
jgi:hypothetical protein